MKRILVLLLALTLLTPVFAQAEGPRTIESAEDAAEWISILFGDAPETLDSGWAVTEQVQASVAQLGGMKGMARVFASLGSLVKIGSPNEISIEGYQIYQFPCVFTLSSVDLMLVLEDGAVAGLNTAPYSGQPEEASEADFEEIGLALPVASLNGELPGTLTLPRGEGPFPAVVLIHGSGPSDRDETLGLVKPFRDLAEGLAARGIAVYRFDKRTYVYGQEIMSDTSFTPVEESVEDAVAAVQLLAQQEKIDPSRILVLGHSLGGNLIPAVDRALREAPVKACGYILMAASARPLDVLMREQTDFLYSLLPDVTPEMEGQKDALFAELDKLQNLDSLPESEAVAGAYVPYWRWLAAYDALSAAGEITVPCLLLQGQEDYQVTLEDYVLWQNALGKNPGWTMVTYPGLTHAFTPGQKTEGSNVYARGAHMDPQVIGNIADFISQITSQY